MESVFKVAAKHLTTYDSVLAPVIASRGLCAIAPHTDYYGELIDSIVSQQLSVKAASTIEGRLKALFNNRYPTPEQILATSNESLRSVGLSRAKASYVKSLAEHIVNGELELEKLSKLSNELVISELTAVKGIGEWTAHMFLMFAMGRLDVLPVGDLGIRNGIKKLYGFDHVPTAIEIEVLAQKNNWHPYESVASWYIWQSLDNMPVL